MRYGAVAEGWFPGVGWLSSLGRAGVNKFGKLKEEACYSLDSAKIRALRSVANKLRFRQSTGGTWVNFKELDEKTKLKLLKEVSANVSWTQYGPTMYRTSPTYSQFNRAFQQYGVA